MTRFTPRRDVMPAPQQRLWPELAAVPSSFVLYGGAALSLRFGYRQSEDFDFFATEGFQVEELLEDLPWLRHGERLQAKTNTLTVLLDRGGPVKVSFFGGLAIGRVGSPQLTADGVLRVAATLDVAATKVAVIQQGAESKDYLDLAEVLGQGIGLEQALAAARALYGESFNPMISLKALTYFEDGDLPTLPDQVKRLLIEAASQVRVLPRIARQSDRIAAD